MLPIVRMLIQALMMGRSQVHPHTLQRLAETAPIRRAAQFTGTHSHSAGHD
jgi:sulfur relay (sulfurtransferase) DsrC/TusE family protein